MAEQYLEKIKLQKATITNIPLLSLESDEIIYEITEQGVYTGRLAVGTGGGPGTHNIFYCQFIQSDWNETDNTKLSFIKNKPILTINEQTVTSSDVITEAGGYGALYNFPSTQGTGDNSITSSDDWVVPTPTICNDMALFLGGTYDSGSGGWLVSGGKLKEIGSLHWDTPNIGATNEVGFNAVGTGARNIFTGDELLFDGFRLYFAMWLSDLTYKSAGCENSTDIFYVGDESYGTFGYSIRLCNPSTILSEGEHGTYTGNNGVAYNTIVINGVEWITSNLNETKFRNGDWITGFDGGTYTPISNSTWAAATSAMMCIYNDNISNL